MLVCRAHIKWARRLVYEADVHALLFWRPTRSSLLNIKRGWLESPSDPLISVIISLWQFGGTQIKLWAALLRVLDSIFDGTLKFGPCTVAALWCQGDIILHTLVLITWFPHYTTVEKVWYQSSLHSNSLTCCIQAPSRSLVSYSLCCPSITECA